MRNAECGVVSPHSPCPIPHCSGQALIEFAIVGSLALLALAFLIQIGLRMNYQQEIEQQTFRRALRVAQNEGEEESQAIQYQHFRNRQIPDPSQGFAIMPRTTSQASATVTWGEGLTFLADDRDSQPRIIVHLDDTEREFRSEDLQDDQPLVGHIRKEIQSASEIQQDNSASRLNTTTTETTTMTLNTNNNDPISSTLTSDVNFNW